MHEPLQVTAHLQSPVVTSDGYLYIDSILSAVVMRQEYGWLEATAANTCIRPVRDLPIAKRGSGDLWYYAASVAQWQGAVSHQTHYWTKSLDMDATFRLSATEHKRVLIAGGPYKGWRMPVFCRHALSVHWYVVGGMAEIRELLAHVPSIGSERARGYGSVLRWDVAPWHADWSERGAAGQVMRCLPAASGVLRGIRPPYWLRENQTTCEVPQ